MQNAFLFDSRWNKEKTVLKRIIFHFIFHVIIILWSQEALIENPINKTGEWQQKQLRQKKIAFNGGRCQEKKNATKKWEQAIG